jgi:hypothetical protein
VITIALLLAVQSASSDWVYYGSGDKSCSKWIADARAGNAGYMVQDAWLAGFISGMNKAEARDLLQRSNMNAAVAQISSYCSAHPNDKLVDAVDDMLRKLQRR